MEISIADYGFRKVATVILNPDEPEYTHPDKSADHVNEKGEKITLGDGLPPCHKCQKNWQIKEFVFDDVKRNWPDGNLVIWIEKQIAMGL